MDFQFKPPTIKDGWYIFPDTILSNINLTDCDSSITGVCENVDTLEGCIDMCKNSKEPCKSGYFIQTPDNQNICVPVLQRTVNTLGPFYRLRNKDIYPIMKKMKTVNFVSTDYKYPPNLPNTIFFTDFFVLRNILTGDMFGVDESGEIGGEQVLSKQSINIQFLPSQINRNYVSNYVAVKNGDNVVISIPHTSFVLRKNDDSPQLSWKMSASITAVIENNTFQVVCPSRKTGEMLSFSDQVYFTFQNYPIIYKDNILSVSEKNIDNVLESKENILFSFLPKFNVHYCQDGECKEIGMDKVVVNGYSGKYEGIDVHRSPSCWNLCGERNERKDGIDNRSNILICVIGILIIIILWAIFVLSVGSRFKHKIENF